MKLRPPSALLTAMAALTLVTAPSARAAEPKLVPCGHVSISSLNDLDKLLADLALPVPFTAASLVEHQYAFIGQGGFQSDKPLGILFIGGEHLSLVQEALLIFPVSKSTLTLEHFASIGAIPVNGHPDMVTIPGPATFRRTTDYVYMYPGAVDLVSSVDEAILAKDYARPGHVATVIFDLAAYRAAAPETYKAAMAKALQNSDPAAAKFVREGFVPFLEKLDRVTVALGQVEKAVHLELWLLPMEFKDAPVFPRPAFPDGVMTQVHLVYPSTDAAHWTSAFIDKIPTDNIEGNKLTPDQTKRSVALSRRIATLFFTPDAQSFALGFAKGMPTAYFVNQYANDTDLAKELPALVEDFHAFGKETAQGDLIDLNSYKTAAGKTVSRLELMDGSKAGAYVDILQNGKVITITIAADDAHRVETVAALPPVGTISNLCSGSLDLAATFKAIETAGLAPALPETKLQQLRLALAGQSITWTAKANPKGKYLYIDIDIPIAIIKQVAQLASSPATSTPAPITTPR